jgi:hypothetical protein
MGSTAGEHRRRSVNMVLSSRQFESHRPVKEGCRSWRYDKAIGYASGYAISYAAGLATGRSVPYWCISQPLKLTTIEA